MLEFTEDQLKVMTSESTPRGLRATQELLRRGISVNQDEVVGELGVELKEAVAVTEEGLEQAEVEQKVIKPKVTQTRKKRSAKPKVKVEDNKENN